MSDRPDLELVPARWSGLSNVVSLLGLGLLVWGVSAELFRRGSHANQPVAVVLLTVASVAWLVALVLRRDDSRLSAAAVGTMALTGGALAAFASSALVFPAVAVFVAAVRWRLEVAAVVGLGGWAATVIAEVAVGASIGVILGGLAGILGGALVGISRRQAVDRTEQLARTEVATARAEVERERAQLLAERNHLAREIHDVLAHTLSALSVQLEAFGTVVDAEPGTSPAVRTQLDRTRELVHEGLDEARRAVGALRDDVVPLDLQLARLCQRHGAHLDVEGVPPSLPAPVVVALYRVVQEGLTNALKHAAGGPTSVRLACAPDRVSVAIENLTGTGSPDLSATGAGYGLQGIGERLALLGGRMEAGPTPGGWQVSATVPLPMAAMAETGGDGS